MPLSTPVANALIAVTNALIALKTTAGKRRTFADIFMYLPDSTLYADYYQIIPEPRCITGVQNAIEDGTYNTAEEAARDMFLIWANARVYNEATSMVVKDANRLEKHMVETWKKHSPPLPNIDALPRPTVLSKAQAAAAGPSSAPAPPPRGGTRIKLKAPGVGAAASPSPAPESYQSPAPAAAPSPAAYMQQSSAAPQYQQQQQMMMQQQQQQQSYAAMSPQGAQPNAAFQQATTSDYGSQAMSPQRATGAPAHGTAASSVDGDVKVELADDLESGWFGGQLGPNPTAVYLEIIRALTEFTDPNTRRSLAGPLMRCPPREQRPDYYNAVPEPMSFEIIQNRAQAGHYTSPEQFDRDLTMLFKVGKIFIKPHVHAQLYGDLLRLQRLYNELTRLRSGPIAGKLYDVSSLTSVSIGPGRIVARDGSPSGQGTEDERGGSNSRYLTRDRTFLRGIHYKGETYRPGDYVHLMNPDNPAKPIIGQIFKTFRRLDSQQRAVSVCWYYRPEETIHPAIRGFYENEVFKTSNFVDHRIEDVLERCMVMYYTRYVRGRPKAPMYTKDMSLYVCESRYKDDTRSFKKIKNWGTAIPEEVRKIEYEMDHFQQPMQLRRVPSPFAAGVKGPGGYGESTEASEEATPLPTGAQQPIMAPGQPQAYPNQPPNVKMEAASPAPTAPSPGPAGYAAAMGMQMGAQQPQPQQTPVPVVATTPALQPTMTVHSSLTGDENFQELPGFAAQKFRTDDKGEVLWFSAPVRSLPSRQPLRHSETYLRWRAEQNSQSADAMDLS